jgi:hypothetical protein
MSAVAAAARSVGRPENIPGVKKWIIRAERQAKALEWASARFASNHGSPAFKPKK